MKSKYSIIKTSVIAAGILFLTGCNFQTSTSNSGIKTVTFDLNGAPGANSTISVETGNAVSAKKVNKESDGYYFINWCTDKEGENPYDFSKVITEDITLYASWKFRVYFYDEIGESTAIDDEYILVRKDHKLDKEPECTKLSGGKRFAYWYTYASTDTNRELPIKFDINVAISEPEIMYYAKCESFNRTFNFYIGNTLIKSSVANSDNEYVDLPSIEQSISTNQGFKGWYTDKTAGERFDFVDFSVVKENYQIETTNLYARYENIEGDKQLSDMVNAYKYKSYGAKITKGIGTSAGTYFISLDDGHTADNTCKYGVALYPTIFKGNLYSKKYTLGLKLGTFKDDNVSIQPRIYILDENGNRVSDGELYTKNGETKTSGSKYYNLYDLMAPGGADYQWTENQYFQIGFEFKQMNSVVGMSSIQIESLNISNSSVELTSDYTFNLAALGDSTLDRCTPSYDSTSQTVKIVNTSTSANVNDGHYCSLTYKSTFSARAGGTYKISVNIVGFSSKCIDGQKNIGFFIQCAALSSDPIHLGNISATGETVLDFSDRITTDCDFTLRMNFVCGEDWQDKEAGYFSNEYVEISSLKIVTQ